MELLSHIFLTTPSLAVLTPLVLLGTTISGLWNLHDIIRNGGWRGQPGSVVNNLLPLLTTDTPFATSLHVVFHAEDFHETKGIQLSSLLYTGTGQG